MTRTHRYCAMCRHYVAPHREAYKDIPPPMPPPWPWSTMLRVPSCPECGEPLGPTLEEIDAEVQGVGDGVNP